MPDIFFNKELRSFLVGLFFVLLADYLFLFGLESILPGFVMGVFNLNWLLLFVLALLSVLALLPEINGMADSTKIKGWQFAVLAAAIFVGVVALIGMYKIVWWQRGTYLLLAAVAGWLVYRAWSNQD